MGFIESVSKSAKPFIFIFLIFGLVLLFTCGGYWVYQKNFATDDSTKFKDVANLNEREKEVTVLFFFADWCPACQKAKPEWNSFSQEYKDGKSINGYNVTCKEINLTENDSSESKEFINKYKIEGIPQIKLLRGSEVVSYRSTITKHKLQTFIKMTLE